MAVGTPIDHRGSTAVVASPATGTFTVSPTANFLLVTLNFDQAAGMAVTGVTYNGVSLTPCGAADTNATQNPYSAAYYLVNPPTGSAFTISITISGTITDIYWDATTYGSVNTTTPIRPGTYQAPTTPAAGAGGTFSLVVASNTNDRTVTVLCSPGGTTGSNQSGGGTYINTGGAYSGSMDFCTTPASSVTHTWSGLTASGPISIVGFSINGDPNNAGGGWSGSGTRRAPAKAGPFDQRGFILSPYQQYSYVPSFTLNAYSFSADPGTYAVTGAAAGLRRGAALPALAGSYTLTGAAAKLLVGHAVNAGTATYAINGVSATELRSLLLNAGTGSYVISGFAATLQAPSPDHPLTVNPATYALTGANAATLRGVRTTVTGAYAISGAAASFLIQRGVPDGPSSYNVNGLAATLIYSGSGPASRVPWQRMGMRIGL